VQSDLPDGAVLVEVDEDDITSDTGQQTPPTPNVQPDFDTQGPMTMASNGSQKTTFLERRKEKGTLCTVHMNDAVDLSLVFFISHLSPHCHVLCFFVY